jgi:hypothetical protein
LHQINASYRADLWPAFRIWRQTHSGVFRALTPRRGNAYKGGQGGRISVTTIRGSNFAVEMSDSGFLLVFSSNFGTIDWHFPDARQPTLSRQVPSVPNVYVSNRCHDTFIAGQHRFESWPGCRMVCNGAIVPCNARSTRNARYPRPSSVFRATGSFAFFIPFIESSTSSRRDCRFGGFLALTDPFLANGDYPYLVGGF